MTTINLNIFINPALVYDDGDGLQASIFDCNYPTLRVLQKFTLTLRYPHVFHSEINRLLAIGLERSARMTQSWR